MIELKDNDLVFAKVKPNAIIPTKDEENAGYDIYACFDNDYIVIPTYTTVLIPTGIAAAVSDNYYLQVHERGSTGSKGIKYGAGVIDSSYRGEIFICITNTNRDDVIISKISKEELLAKYGKYDKEDDAFIELVDESKGYHDRVYFDYAIMYPYEKAIAQLVVHEVPKMNVKEITYEELKNIPSKRGTGALGSSGK
jgi:dUTP pyrophosphatase